MVKKVVLILDGIVAKNFLQVVLEKYFSNNTYIIVSNDETMIPEEIPSSFSFHIFDATSSFRLLGVLDPEVSDCFILMQDLKERKVVYDIVRNAYKDMRIIVDVRHKEEARDYDHEKTLLLDESVLISGAMIAKLPNVPLIPQGFGLGVGEVMEINVPFGSAYAYRHIGSIHQKDYRIAGIYRHNEFILSNYSLTIQPTDTLLVVGDPKVLTTVYRQVKSDMGQFPAPFGKDIYLYVDMIKQDFNELMHDISQAIYLHNQLRNTRLYIYVLHPSDMDIIREIKAVDTKDVSVIFNYQGEDFCEAFKKHQKLKIGLLVISPKLFRQKKVRKMLFVSGVPVFKTSYKDIAHAKTSLVVLNEDMNQGENLSSVIFDISMQMNLDITIYDFEPDKNHQDEMVREYQNLSRIYDKKVLVNKTNTKNPIVYLREHKEPVLHFLPFERCIAGGMNFINFLSTRIEKISFMSEEHPQIFIPVLEKLDEH
nr:TrkA C-terminal domain-containing protein [Helicobacter anatolicus]